MRKIQKQFSKFIAFALTLILCVSCMAFSVSAATTKESLLPDGKLSVGNASGTGIWECKTENNQVTFTGTDTASAWGFAFVDGNFSDYNIKLTVNKWTDGGILLRASDNGKGLNGYMVGADGVNMYLAKYTDGQFGLMSSAEQAVEGGAAFAAAYTQLSDVTWTIVVKDNTISVYIDNSETPLIQAKDASYTSGAVGFQHKTAADKGLSLDVTGLEIYTEKEVTDNNNTNNNNTDNNNTDNNNTNHESGNNTETTDTTPKAPYSLGDKLADINKLADLDASGTGKWATSGEMLTFTGTDSANAWGFGFIKEQSFDDFIIKLDIDKWTDGGVVVRAFSEGNGLNGYMVGTDGVNIYLAKYTNDKFALMNSEEQAVEGGAAFAAPYTQLSDVTWMIVVKGDVISVYIDDSTTPIIQAKDSSYTTGGIGFQHKTAADKGLSMTISNFGIYKIGSASTGEDMGATMPVVILLALAAVMTCVFAIKQRKYVVR